MKMSKEEFATKMIRHELGKKQTKLNTLMKKEKKKYAHADDFRFEGREKNLRRGNVKSLPRGSKV